MIDGEIFRFHHFFGLVMCEIIDVVLVAFKNSIHRRRCLCERCPTQGDGH